MNKTKISIIIPIYNAEKYVSRCIESILKQTMPDFELILVNDGSTDNSYKICKNYADKDSRINLISQPNSGSSAARNNGIDNAKGEYIEFVDADDYLDADTLEILYNRALSSSADAVVFGIKNINPKSISVVEVIDGDYTLPEFLQFYSKYISNAVIGASWNKLYKRSCLGNTRYIVGIHNNEDTYFNFDMLKKCSVISVQSGVYYNYVHYSNSMSSRPIPGLFNIYEKTHIKSIEFLKDTGTYESNILAQNTRFINLTIAAIYQIVKNSEEKKDKLAQIKTILNNKYVISAVRQSQKTDFTKSILFFLIKHKMSLFIYLLCLAKSI